MCFTAQSGSGIPRSPYQDEIELRGQFNLRSPFHGLKNRCKAYVCALFLSCVPSAPSLKIPAYCLVRVFQYPLGTINSSIKHKPQSLLFSNNSSAKKLSAIHFYKAASIPVFSQ